MSHAPPTRSSLLVRLRDPADEEAWGHFVRVYGPVVYHFARRRWLQDSDSADVTQDVLHAVMTGADRLEQIHRRGSLRSWLFTVAHHKVYDLQKRRQRAGQGSGESDVHAALHEQPVREEEDAWDLEYRKQLFACAAQEVRAQCSPGHWQAFWQTAVEGRSPAAVAEALGLSVAAVYLAKSRIMARLKQRVRLWDAVDDEAPCGLALGRR
jgi:RNA polymerase sigma-70 factor (ECF subfamily)